MLAACAPQIPPMPGLPVPTGCRPPAAASEPDWQAVSYALLSYLQQSRIVPIPAGARQWSTLHRAQPPAISPLSLRNETHLRWKQKLAVPQGVGSLVVKGLPAMRKESAEGVPAQQESYGCPCASIRNTAEFPALALILMKTSSAPPMLPYRSSHLILTSSDERSKFPAEA